MRKSLHIVTVALLMAAFAGAALADAEPAGEPAAAPAGVVNINTADAAQLALLPRVGEKVAQRIVDYRGQHGTFKKTSELMQVKGIGAKTYERLSPYVAVEGKTTLGAKVSSPRKPRAKSPASPASH
ncbi:MAG TPA: helix-hairpin-helix domain-containing protein [Thermoanaerobaculia bacterium]|jgi:competence protein ComEA